MQLGMSAKCQKQTSQAALQMDVRSICLFQHTPLDRYHIDS